jgi:arginine deiminase
VREIAAERDQLAEDLAARGREIEQLSGDLIDAAERNNALSNRHRLSIEHNNELTEANARLTRQLTALTAERDQLRGERDEAVAKLAERTPAHERFGSPERQAEQAGAEAAAANGHTNGRTPIKGHAFAGLVNGRNRDREMEMEL